MPAGVFPPERWDAAAALLKAGKFDEFASFMKQYDAKFEAGYDFGTWTPAFLFGTTVTSSFGWYIRFERRLVIAGFRCVVNAVGSIGPGTINNLPFRVGGISGSQAIGTCYLTDTSAPAANRTGTLVGETIVGLGENSTGGFQDLPATAFIMTDGGFVSTTNPFTWATGDVITGLLIYPIAPSTGV